jgi:hypothetical protein
MNYFKLILDEYKTEQCELRNFHLSSLADHLVYCYSNHDILYEFQYYERINQVGDRMSCDNNQIDDVELWIDVFNRHQTEIRSLKDEAILERIQRYEKALGRLRAMVHSCNSTLEDRYSAATLAEKENFQVIARKYKVRNSPFDKPKKEKRPVDTLESLQAQLAMLQKRKAAITDEDED